MIEEKHKFEDERGRFLKLIDWLEKDLETYKQNPRVNPKSVLVKERTLDTLRDLSAALDAYLLVLEDTLTQTTIPLTPQQNPSPYNIHERAFVKIGSYVVPCIVRRVMIEYSLCEYQVRYQIKSFDLKHDTVVLPSQIFKSPKQALENHIN